MEQITARDFSFRYPNAKADALSGVSFTVPAGSFTLLCGSSGSGKTTLLRSLKPQLAPHGETKGEILLGQEKLSGLSLRASAEKIGFVMQTPENQIVTDTVWHELAFGLENLGLPTQIIRRRVAETANFFGIHTWFEKKVEELSGGQKQILNLAAVMAMQPEIIILDEPTAQLDPIAASEFLQAMQKVNTELGVTVILSEHRLENVLPIAEQVLYLEEGRLAFAGGREAFVDFLRRQERMQRLLPSASRIYLLLKGEGKPPISVKEGREFLSRLSFGKKREQAKNIAEKKDPVLSVQEAWFRYRKTEEFVLRGMELSLYPGEMTCLVGGNGSGKSTALWLMAGAYQPLRGKVCRKKDARVAMLAQEAKTVFLCDTVEEELRLAAGKDGDIQSVTAEMHLGSLLERHPYDLSGGEMQRAALAKLLLTRPDILLLDEPTKGLDVFAKEELAATLERIMKQGKAVCLVTHDLEFAARYADHCGMMFDGRVLSFGSAREFFLDNNFYTTGANRITRGILPGCVLAEDVLLYER